MQDSIMSTLNGFNIDTSDKSTYGESTTIDPSSIDWVIGMVVKAKKSNCDNGDGKDVSSEFDKSSWMIAVSIAIFAAVINNIGVNLQKLAWTKMQIQTSQQEQQPIHEIEQPSATASDIGTSSVAMAAGTEASNSNGNNDEDSPLHQELLSSNNKKSNFTSYKLYWLLGMVGIFAASILDFMALAFGPQSVIAPLGSLTMVANSFIAPYMHGESLHKQVLTSTLVILFGCFVSVSAASHQNDICGVDALFDLYKSTKFYIYVSAISFTIILGVFAANRCEKIEKEKGKESREYLEVFKFHRFIYAAISGIFGAQSVVFAKSIDVLLVSSIRGDKIFLAYPATYMVLAGLVLCIVMQLYWLNLGLARFESLYNVPVSVNNPLNVFLCLCLTLIYRCLHQHGSLVQVLQEGLCLESSVISVCFRHLHFHLVFFYVAWECSF